VVTFVDRIVASDEQKAEQIKEEELLSLVSKISRFDFTPTTDDIYFLHIPKTAGSALTELLRFLKFCPTPGGCGQKFLPNGQPDFAHPVTGMEKECCCIHTCIGHQVYDDMIRVQNEIAKNSKRLFSVTILREPVGRTTSEYWYIAEIVKEGLKPQFVPRRIYPELINGSMTLSNLIKTSNESLATKCCGFVNNRQTTMLAGIDEYYKFKNLGDEKVFEKAWDNLMAMDYFGMADQWTDSVELLLWTFGQSERNFLAANVTWNRVHPHPKPTQEEKDLLLEANKMDTELVNLARVVFNERLKIMRADKAKKSRSTT